MVFENDVDLGTLNGVLLNRNIPLQSRIKTVLILLLKLERENSLATIHECGIWVECLEYLQSTDIVIKDKMAILLYLSHVAAFAGNLLQSIMVPLVPVITQQCIEHAQLQATGFSFVISIVNQIPSTAPIVLGLLTIDRLMDMLNSDDIYKNALCSVIIKNYPDENFIRHEILPRNVVRLLVKILQKAVVVTHYTNAANALIAIVDERFQDSLVVQQLMANECLVALARCLDPLEPMRCESAMSVIFQIPTKNESIYSSLVRVGIIHQIQQISGNLLSASRLRMIASTILQMFADVM